MDTQDFDALASAEQRLELLADSRNWYDEHPKMGGPDVIAWRGPDPTDPERIAHRALSFVRQVINRCVEREESRPPTVKEFDIHNRRTLVLNSIASIRSAEQRNRECQMDPTSDADDRDAARHCLDACIREFSHQWKNVELLLKD